jgi:hypothetical protein
LADKKIPREKDPFKDWIPRSGVASDEVYPLVSFFAFLALVATLSHPFADIPFTRDEPARHNFPPLVIARAGVVLGRCRRGV